MGIFDRFQARQASLELPDRADADAADVLHDLPPVAPAARPQLQRLASSRDDGGSFRYADATATEGKLRVRVVQARNLRKRHLLAPDGSPQVIVEMHDWEDKKYAAETAVREGAGRAARWDERFTFFHRHDGPGELVDAMLHVRVVDGDFEVGATRLPLCMFVGRAAPSFGREDVQWFELEGRSGEVELGVEFQVDGAAPAAPAAAPATARPPVAATATADVGLRSLQRSTSLSPDEIVLFRQYDADGDGQLDPGEFKRMLRDLALAGGNVKMLAGRGNSGCLGLIFCSPREDLLAYVRRMHTLLFVCNGYARENISTTPHQRMLLVLMTMLLSLVLNCVSEVRIGGAALPRFTFVVVADAMGVTFVKQLFLQSHNLRFPVAVRGLLQVLFWAIGLAIVLVTFAAMDGDQQDEVLGAFLPLWCSSRVTEVFKVGFVWALKLQFGSPRGKFI